MISSSHILGTAGWFGLISVLPSIAQTAQHGPINKPHVTAVQIRWLGKPGLQDFWWAHPHAVFSDWCVQVSSFSRGKAVTQDDTFKLLRAIYPALYNKCLCEKDDQVNQVPQTLLNSGGVGAVLRSLPSQSFYRRTCCPLAVISIFLCYFYEWKFLR